jgi:hypothetical protein
METKDGYFGELFPVTVNLTQYSLHEEDAVEDIKIHLIELDPILACLVRYPDPGKSY